MLALILKTIHVISATMFFGAGAVSAYYKLRADRSGDPAIAAWYLNELVLSDWLFTTTSGVALAVSGLWLATIYSLPWTTDWILWGIGCYLIAGLFWLPAVGLQYRMRRLAREAVETKTPLPAAYHRATRQWIALGVFAFAAAAIAIWVMVTKKAP